jgi:hypothetical protein
MANNPNKAVEMSGMPYVGGLSRSASHLLVVLMYLGEAAATTPNVELMRLSEIRSTNRFYEARKELLATGWLRRDNETYTIPHTPIQRQTITEQNLNKNRNKTEGVSNLNINYIKLETPLNEPVVRDETIQFGDSPIIGGPNVRPEVQMFDLRSNSSTISAADSPNTRPLVQISDLKSNSSTISSTDSPIVRPEVQISDQEDPEDLYYRCEVADRMPIEDGEYGPKFLARRKKQQELLVRAVAFLFPDQPAPNKDRMNEWLREAYNSALNVYTTLERVKAARERKANTDTPLDFTGPGRSFAGYIRGALKGRREKHEIHPIEQPVTSTAGGDAVDEEEEECTVTPEEIARVSSDLKRRLAEAGMSW